MILTISDLSLPSPSLPPSLFFRDQPEPKPKYLGVGEEERDYPIRDPGQRQATQTEDGRQVSSPWNHTPCRAPP